MVRPVVFKDLRGSIVQLEQCDALKHIRVLISPVLEMTEVHDRTLRVEGPALSFEKPTSLDTPVLGNLLGTPERVALGMGAEDVGALREIGKSLVQLRESEPPKGLEDAWTELPMYRKVLPMAPKVLEGTLCQEVIEEDEDVDFGRLPVQTCWPGDVGSLITQSLTVIRGPNREWQNLGIYRQQTTSRNKVIVRWLNRRGGALDYREWCQRHSSQPYPVTMVLGVDPATIPGAVAPVPDTLPEYAFTGLLHGHHTESVKCRGSDLQVSASAEIVPEGVIHPGEMVNEGPYGDHTGYYSEVDRLPVLIVERVTCWQRPVYHSTYTGCPPDGSATLGVALSEAFALVLQKRFPEVINFYPLPGGCSYRVVVVTVEKQHPGHAKCMMLRAWSFLRQFMYTRFVIVADDDIDTRDWNDVIWVITMRMDPKCDAVMIDNMPIDCLDFASPVSGLGSKMGLDATHKWPGETSRG